MIKNVLLYERTQKITFVEFVLCMHETDGEEKL